MTKTYTIPKNKHYCFHLPRFHFNTKDIKLKFKFKSSCRYSITGSDSLDINKLSGLSFGLHHTNSFRIGWRYVPISDKIELLHYFYNNEQRYFKIIGFCNIDETTTIDIHLNRTCNSISTYIKGDERFSYFDFEDVPKFGYYLFPYFGGNKLAPHKMNIELNINPRTWGY